MPSRSSTSISKQLDRLKVNPENIVWEGNYEGEDELIARRSFNVIFLRKSQSYMSCLFLHIIKIFLRGLYYENNLRLCRLRKLRLGT